jgi:uncharacterized membrane protein
MTKVETPEFQIPWTGLATAFTWAVSPIFIRMGLAELGKVKLTGTTASLLGVIIGILVNVVVYGLLLWWRRSSWQGKPIPSRAIYWQLGAAIFVALSTWARWIALDLAPLAVVTAIVRISVPVVIVLSLLMLDQTHERVNWRVWLGGFMIIGGAMLLSFSN